MKHGLRKKLSSVLVFLLLINSLFFANPFSSTSVLAAGSISDNPIVKTGAFPGKIGVGVDVNEQTRVYVDMTTGNPRFQDTTLDSNGWPAGNFDYVVFDARPFGAWDNTTTDPLNYHMDMTGTYKMSFKGSADIARVDGSFTIANQQYDAGTNTTTVDIIVTDSGSVSQDGLVYLRFTNTKRMPDSTAGDGVTDMKVIRPGYAADTTQVFTDEFIASLRPFSTLRFMGWLDSNNTNPDYNAADNTIDWAERKPAHNGRSWENLVALANLVNKDIWINIPIHASDDYVAGLANYLKNNLNPGIKVYLEYNNEVWNWAFWQTSYNRAAALDEIAKNPDSNLKSGGVTDEGVIAARRYAKRLLQIEDIFRNVYDPGAINSTILPVLCWQFENDWYFDQMLSWINSNYGAPGNYLYGVAGAPYFKPEAATISSTPEQIVDALRAQSDTLVTFHKKLKTVAQNYGLKYMTYEGGSDTGSGAANMGTRANQITAERSPKMKDVIEHDIRDNFFGNGGDLYMALATASQYNQFGCWGLTENSANTNTYKYHAIYDLTDTWTQVPGVPANLRSQGANNKVLLSWGAVDKAISYNVLRSTTQDSGFTPYVNSINVNRFEDTSVTNGTTYYYKIVAVNSAGVGAESEVISAVPQLTVPTAPSDLAAGTGLLSVSLSWNAPEDAASYNVKRSVVSGGTYETIAAGVTTTSYYDIDVEAGKTYYYVVSASNEAGESVNSQEVSAAPSSSAVKYEAESGIMTGGSVNSSAGLAGYSGTGYWDRVSLGSSDTFTVVAPLAGTYPISVGYFNTGALGTCDYTISLYVNGTDVGQLHMPGTGSTNWKDSVAINAELNAGVNTIKLQFDSNDNINNPIDYLLVSPGTAVEPNPEPEPLKYEMEDGARIGGAIETGIPGYSGTGFWDWFVAGDSNTFTVNVETAGTYPISVRYYNDGAVGTSIHTISLYVNGTDMGQLLMPGTGGNTWVNSAAIDAVLQAGDNTIKLQVDSDDALRNVIDTLLVLPATAVEPTPEPEPGKYEL